MRIKFNFEETYFIAADALVFMISWGLINCKVQLFLSALPIKFHSGIFNDYVSDGWKVIY